MNGDINMKRKIINFPKDFFQKKRKNISNKEALKGIIPFFSKEEILKIKKIKKDEL